MQDLLVRHDHRERHRYRSRLRASQRGRDHRVPIGRVHDRMVHWSTAPAPPRTERRRVTYRAARGALASGAHHPAAGHPSPALPRIDAMCARADIFAEREVMEYRQRIGLTPP